MEEALTELNDDLQEESESDHSDVTDFGQYYQTYKLGSTPELVFSFYQ